MDQQEVNLSPAESPLFYSGRKLMRLNYWLTQLTKEKQESPPHFIVSKGMGKKRTKPKKKFREKGYGGWLCKGKVLAPLTSIVLYRNLLFILCKRILLLLFVLQKGLMDKRHISFKRKRHFVISRKYQSSKSPHKGKRGVLCIIREGLQLGINHQVCHITLLST